MPAAPHQKLLPYIVARYSDEASGPERAANGVDDEARYWRKATEAGEDVYSE